MHIILLITHRMKRYTLLIIHSFVKVQSRNIFMEWTIWLFINFIQNSFWCTQEEEEEERDQEYYWAMTLIKDLKMIEDHKV